MVCWSVVVPEGVIARPLVVKDVSGVRFWCVTQPVFISRGLSETVEMESWLFTHAVCLSKIALSSFSID